MKENGDERNEGLNQLLEIINAKGDTGELQKIVEGSSDILENEKSDSTS